MRASARADRGMFVRCVPVPYGPDLGSNRLKWSALAGPLVGDSEAVHANEAS